MRECVCVVLGKVIGIFVVLVVLQCHVPPFLRSFLSRLIENVSVCSVKELSLVLRQVDSSIIPALTLSKTVLLRVCK